MSSRSEPLQTLLDEVCRLVRASPARTPDAERTIGRVEAALREVPSGGASDRKPGRLPACAWLDQALDVEDDRTRRLLDAFRAIEPRLAWIQRAGLVGSARFPDGHANTLIVGPNGLESRDDVWVGASLLAPDITYPVHHHPPEEVYLVLSEGEWWREESGWTTPGLGGTVYNTPDVLHSFRSASRPLFAIWALPIH